MSRVVPTLDRPVDSCSRPDCRPFLPVCRPPALVVTGPIPGTLVSLPSPNTLISSTGVDWYCRTPVALRLANPYESPKWTLAMTDKV